MRLAGPVYECLPLGYGLVGLVAFYTFHIDPSESRSKVAFGIGILAVVAAVTLALHRQDCRALRREYSGETLEL